MEKTIIEILEEVPDYRKGNGIRHKLVDILMIGLFTVICNRNDFVAMHLFGETHEALLKTFLELPNGIPSHDTFERVFSKTNSKILSEKFRIWIVDLKKLIEKNLYNSSNREFSSLDT